MDLPLALEQLTKDGRLTPADDWGPCANTGDSYASFAAGWRGPSPVPTKAELNSAWSLIEAAGGVAAIETAKQRAAAAALLGDTGAPNKVLRALALTTLKAVNAIRAKLVLPLPAISKADWKAAILSEINTGDADS